MPRFDMPSSVGVTSTADPTASASGRTRLEQIGTAYRTAYLAHDPKLAPFDATVRFTENSVEMPLPDGTWDTVTREVGPALTISDPITGNVGIYTSIMQKDVPGFLAIRLRVVDGLITEVEQVISTRRNLSSPPTPIGPVEGFEHDADLARPVDPADRMTRADLIAMADAYFETLQNNTGVLRGGARFRADATRSENGMTFPEIEKGFRSGRYRFNERVRDREYFLVDEARGIVMARGFIDHKGVLDDYALTDGTPQTSAFREPQSWGLLEMFKIKRGEITGVEAVFVQTPYYMRSPWTKVLDRRSGGLTPPAPKTPPSSPASTNPPLDQ
ncbi:MAG TPA: hypothetical protein VIJ94_05160 [Caulobacteraceae bacterium]